MWKNVGAFLKLLRVVTALGLVGGAMYAAYDGDVYRTPTAAPAPAPRGPALPNELAPLPKDATPHALLVSTPNDAVRWAWADTQTIPPAERCFFRYAWMRDGLPASRRTVSIAANYSGRGTSPVMPPMVLFGGLVARIDLRHYWPTYEDLKEVICIWEDFRFDPSFNRLVTKDTLDLLERFGRFSKEEFKHRWDEVLKTNVLRLPSPHVDQFLYRQLQEALHTEAPVVESLYYITRSLSTIRGNGQGDAKADAVFDAIWGGRYYQLRGIRKAKDVLGQDTKVTDLDFYFTDRLGIGDRKNIRAGFAKELFDRLRSDDRMATTRSEITGAPRDVLFFNVPAAQAFRSVAWGAITGDIAQADVSPGQRAYMNLLEPFRRARESIFYSSNATRDFAMWKEEDGSRQDEVPFNVGNDSTIPRPYPQRLQTPGCFRCHEIFGDDGWRPVRNSVRNTLRQAKGPDVLTDLQGLRETNDPFGVNARIANAYTGDSTKAFRRGRDDIAEARLRICGPIKGEDQTQIVKLTGQRFADEYADYNYTMVDAKKALYTLGLDVPAEYAQKVMEVVLGPDIERSRLGDVVFEDARIAYPRSGEPVLPTDWWLSYSFAAERYQRNVKRLLLIGGPQWAEKLLKD